MEFNENTQFPVFSKRSNNAYYCYISLYAWIELVPGTDKAVLSHQDYTLEMFPEEQTITKEEFIEANRDLLEKTGLINLLDKNCDCKLQKELQSTNERINNFNYEVLKDNIRSLEETNKELQSIILNGNESDRKHRIRVVDLECELQEVKKLLKFYL